MSCSCITGVIAVRYHSISEMNSVEYSRDKLLDLYSYLHDCDTL